MIPPFKILFYLGATSALHASVQAQAPAALEFQLFGPGRGLELSIDAALQIAESSDIGLQLEDVNLEVARFDAAGSWGNFDWMFAAGGQLADGEQKGSSTLTGADVLKFESQTYDFSFTRALETGGSFVAAFDTNIVSTNNAFSNLPASSTDNLRLSYSQPLLRGFGADYGTSVQNEAAVSYRRQREHRREVLQALLKDVHDAYWDLVLAGEQLGVAASSLDLGLEQLERNQRMLTAGVGTEVEVIQAEAEVAQRMEALLRAEVALRAAEDALKGLIFPGRDSATWNTELIPITPLPVEASTEVAPWEQLLELALVKRPELRQQRFEIQAAVLRHERTVSERRMGLDLDLSVNSQSFSGNEGQAAKEALAFDFPTYTAGLKFSAPINNRSARFLEKAARARVRAAYLTYDQLETRIVGEVREAVRQVRYQAEAVSAAQTSLEATRRQLAAEEARYQNDLSTNFQLLEFQQRLAEALNTEKSARAGHAKALYALQVAQGTAGEVY
ncbi:MAG: TolC family protein [bacterium]